MPFPPAYISGMSAGSTFLYGVPFAWHFLMLTQAGTAVTVNRGIGIIGKARAFPEFLLGTSACHKVVGSAFL